MKTFWKIFCLFIVVAGVVGLCFASLPWYVLAIIIVIWVLVGLFLTDQFTNDGDITDWFKGLFPDTGPATMPKRKTLIRIGVAAVILVSGAALWEFWDDIFGPAKEPVTKTEVVVANTHEHRSVTVDTANHCVIITDSLYADAMDTVYKQVVIVKPGTLTENGQETIYAENPQQTEASEGGKKSNETSEQRAARERKEGKKTGGETSEQDVATQKTKKVKTSEQLAAEQRAAEKQDQKTRDANAKTRTKPAPKTGTTGTGTVPPTLNNNFLSKFGYQQQKTNQEQQPFNTANAPSPGRIPH